MSRRSLENFDEIFLNWLPSLSLNMDLEILMPDEACPLRGELKRPFRTVDGCVTFGIYNCLLGGTSTLVSRETLIWRIRLVGSPRVSLNCGKRSILQHCFLAVIVNLGS